MSLGLRIEGKREASEPGRFLDALRGALEARDDDPRPVVERAEDEPVLFAELHPGAEPIRFEVSEATIVAEGNTATAGPGYHRHVCELLDALGETLGIAWRRSPEEDHEEPGDETGYFVHRDPDALEEHFLDWLGAMVARALELADEGMSGLALMLPAGHAFEHDGFVATQLGPRDRAWMRAILEDPRSGVDVFPWWSAGRDARYFRDLALTRMWTEVRWRAPLDDDERALLESVVTWIERAHGLDPTIPLPWIEQSELFGHLEEESLRATRAHVKSEGRRAAQLVGYRRRPVRAVLSGGWTLTVPGELAETWEERGTWVGWDATRAVWFTSLSVREVDGEPSPSAEETLRHLPPLRSEELLELERGELRGLAGFVEEEHDGELVQRLEAHAAMGPHAAIGTIVFGDPKDREWAMATWASLTRRG
jgi:hypothetical protein